MLTEHCFSKELRTDSFRISEANATLETSSLTNVTASVTLQHQHLNKAEVLQYEQNAILIPYQKEKGGEGDRKDV